MGSLSALLGAAIAQLTGDVTRIDGDAEHLGVVPRFGPRSEAYATPCRVAAQLTQRDRGMVIVDSSNANG